MTKVTALFISEDPGGADVLVPLWWRLSQRHDFRPVVLSRTHGCAVWTRQGIPVECLRSSSVDEEIEEAIAYLGKIRPDILLSSTSFPRQLEKSFRREARKLGIPAITVMDADRTDHYASSPDDLTCRGTHVLSISEEMNRALVSAGYASDRVINTGHLGYGQIMTEGAAISPATLDNWARNFRTAPEGHQLITIFSDNISEVFGDDGALAEIGYHEKQVVPRLLSAIERAAEANGDSYEVVVKLHPKEARDKFDSVVRGFDNSRLTVRVIEDCENIPLILSSDRILGMYSIIMVWGALLGKPALSIQPNARKNSFLATAKDGSTPVHWSFDGMEDVVRRFLCDEDWYRQLQIRLAAWQPPVDGLDQAEALICELTGVPAHNP